MAILKKMVDHEYKELRRFEKIANQIEALDEEYQKLSDEELKNKTVEFKKRLNEGETLLSKRILYLEETRARIEKISNNQTIRYRAN